MPLYQIDRDLTGLDQNDMEGAALRALACAYWFEGMRWIRSFVNEETNHATCIYEANSAEDVREHAIVANIPCDEVREVKEIGPHLFEARGPEGAAEPSAPLTDLPPLPPSLRTPGRLSQRSVRSAAR